jgi:hypothetical protein
MPQRWTPWSPETQPLQVMHTQSARVRVCFMICLCVRVAFVEKSRAAGRAAMSKSLLRHICKMCRLFALNAG